LSAASYIETIVSNCSKINNESIPSSARVNKLVPKGEGSSIERQQSLVSVIIATHNYGRYIPETIKSVLNQTYTNLEIIVIDDGSTDNTREIVKQYPVKYFYQDHRGGPSVFNAGIRLSHGEFFTKPDADDILHPKYVEMCLSEMLRDDRIGFVWTAAKEFGDAHRLLKPSPLPYHFSVYGGPGGQLGAMLLRRKA
jgi:cellulose synthase/poly-beta-1,6-N-acetylglucosamine synthase-like glycosyltransferase